MQSEVSEMAGSIRTTARGGIGASAGMDVSMAGSAMQWAVAAPWFLTSSEQWVSDFVPGTRHTFVTVPRIGEHQNWHNRKRRATAADEWVRLLRMGRRALRMAGDEGGVITVLPQLAATVAVNKRLARRDNPLLSWFFNTELEREHRVLEARLTLAPVDRFIVHSAREIELYAKLLSLPAEKFAFVHLQYGGELATDEVEEDDPFVFTTGSGYRDYQTFFAAIAKLGYKTLVLAGERALAGLTPPPSVTILDQIPKPEIHRLVRRARVNVVPMNEHGANAGLITMVEAFLHGRGLVSTMRPGVEDYILPGVNAVVADLFDVDGMAEAIEAMWTDTALREKLNHGALDFGRTWCTDEAAGRALGRHLDDLADGRRR